MNLARMSIDAPALLLVIFAFIAVMSVIQNRTRERKERLRALEEAIRNGQLDDETKRDLVTELTGRRPRPHRGSVSEHGRLALVFGLGWLGLFLGVGLMMSGDNDAFEAGSVIAPLSFGLVTLPLALRELAARRGA
jgi:hypothetical protein